MISQVVAATALGAVVITLGIWLGDREKPYEPTSGTITPQSVEAGGWLSVTFRGRRNRSCDGTVYRQMVETNSGKVHSYDPVPAIMREQTTDPDQEVKREVKLPATIMPGPDDPDLGVIYRVIACYTCNPLQRLVWPICVRAPELYFTVIHAKITNLEQRRRLQRLLGGLDK